MAVFQKSQISPYVGLTPVPEPDRGAFVPFIVLALPTLLPSAVFYLFPVPSISTGMLIACIAILAMAAIGIIRTPPDFQRARFLSTVAIIVILIALHLVVASLFVETEFARALQSLVLLVLFLASAAPIAGMMRQYGGSINRAANWMRVLLVGVALLGFARIQPPQYGVAVSVDKSVFPYAEPSHYALIFAPFLLHACICARGWSRYFWIGVSLLLTYSLQSLSLALATLLVAIICFPVSRLALMAIGAFVLLPVLDVDYFVERLDFSLYSSSISSLVYRQGWELAADAAYRTSGWGIGFQQLGFVPFFSPAADVLLQILRDDTNLRDGSFLGGKILSELGALGALFLLGYIGFAARSALWLRKYANSPPRTSPEDAVEVFARSFICGTILEFFVRGIGYFSGSLLIGISGFIYVSFMQQKRRS